MLLLQEIPKGASFSVAATSHLGLLPVFGHVSHAAISRIQAASLSKGLPVTDALRWNPQHLRPRRRTSALRLDSYKSTKRASLSGLDNKRQTDGCAALRCHRELSFPRAGRAGLYPSASKLEDKGPAKLKCWFFQV